VVLKNLLDGRNLVKKEVVSARGNKKLAKLRNFLLTALRRRDKLLPSAKMEKSTSEPPIQRVGSR
jgi:hypothetical protein